MMEEQPRRDVAEEMATIVNREVVSREIADALARKFDIVEAMSDEELLQALWEAIPRAYQIARQRSAESDG